jgi:hypothetical protein
LIGGSLLALFGNSPAYAQSRAHVDRLALQLQRQTRDLHREVHLHFRSTPQYRHLARDISEMDRLATHLHGVAHRQGSRTHLRADVDRLDRLFHHVEELVDEMAALRWIDRRALTHLRQSLVQVGRTLHHVQEDLEPVDHDRPSRPIPDRRRN